MENESVKSLFSDRHILRYKSLQTDTFSEGVVQKKDLLPSSLNLLTVSYPKSVQYT
jgi:hypothetical protein